MWIQFSILFLSYILQLQAAATYDRDEAVKQDLLNIFNNEPLTVRPIQTEPVTAEKIKYYLFTNDHPNNYTVMNTTHPQISSTALIAIFLHGFLDTTHGTLGQHIKDAFLKKDHRYHVILVDWDIYADQALYLVAANDAKDVGRFVAEFIFRLHKRCFVPLASIVVLGHSLGGQTLGFIGQRFQEVAHTKLQRLIGLDPAGPQYNDKPANQRISRDDAKYVFILHTNGGGLGYDKACGRIDFYPNGGRFQPGCLLTFLMNATDVVENIMCSHTRAVKLFVSALTRKNAYRSRKCNSWNQYQLSPSSCPRHFEYISNINTTKTGSYYCKTDSEEPF